ncbi:MAG TPA: twin transmembrane helix small protein [Usitatibacteraceae bacterium]
MKILIGVLLLLVVLSLFSGLYFMYKDKGNSRRVVRALTIRVALSITIIVIVILSYLFGSFPPR